MIRTGIGYDVHRLVADRKLILGGIEIPFEKGSLGHSDGDAVCHAIADALLGASALGDIGQHFPDTDDAYEGFRSVDFLSRVKTMLDEVGYSIENVDATIILQEPKVAVYIPQMRQLIAEALECDLALISVKATTTEKLGITGRGEAVAAQAICTLRSSISGG
jgi:2-C-methyl-D-erythritol 2,4-cyclodiphosphate synthase